jgi:hypothetical protein
LPQWIEVTDMPAIRPPLALSLRTATSSRLHPFSTHERCGTNLGRDMRCEIAMSYPEER